MLTMIGAMVKKLLLELTAIEYRRIGASISLLSNDSNRICAFQSESRVSPDAIAVRDILNDETLVFDTGPNTNDLLRPRRVGI